MRTRKLKKLAITAVMTVLLLSFAITAFAASQHYEYPVNTTAVNKARTYTGVIAGRVTGHAKISIVNQGTETEYYSAKFGAATTGRQKVDGTKKYFPAGGTYISGGTITVGVYRTADTGTTMQGYVEADVNS